MLYKKELHTVKCHSFYSCSKVRCIKQFSPFAANAVGQVGYLVRTEKCYKDIWIFSSQEKDYTVPKDYLDKNHFDLIDVSSCIVDYFNYDNFYFTYKDNSFTLFYKLDATTHCSLLPSSFLLRNIEDNVFMDIITGYTYTAVDLKSSTISNEIFSIKNELNVLTLEDSTSLIDNRYIKTTLSLLSDKDSSDLLKNLANSIKCVDNTLGLSATFQKL